MNLLGQFIEKNGLVVAFLQVGIILLLAQFISKNISANKIPTPAVAIILALILAYFGGVKGAANIPLFAGLGQLGGAMFRDFAIVATAFGASMLLMRQSGRVGVVALFLGVVLSFSLGVAIAWAMGYTDPKSLTTIGAGACTYIVGPVTGAAIGASSTIIALSIATGVVKAIFVTIATPLLAKKLGINNPQTAMIFGGLMGTNTGVMAGLAATDPKLVPYGALTATFYTGLGCLLCPSVFYYIINILF
jgi:malonate transporter MadM subunit